MGATMSRRRMDDKKRNLKLKEKKTGVEIPAKVEAPKAKPKGK